MAQTIPKLLLEIAREYPAHAAQYSKDDDGVFQPTSFSELLEEVKVFASGLADLGVNRGDHVGLISDNRKEWLIADLAVLSLGAADVPRGCDSTAEEISFILGYSECTISFAENTAQLEKIASQRKSLPKLQTIIVLDNCFDQKQHADAAKGFRVHNFADVVKRGTEYLAKNPDYVTDEIEAGNGDDTATLIFTSGTTGTPKGVMLSHRNFLHQVECVPLLITVGPGDRWLSVLPVWHSFERIMQYVAIGSASSLGYSKLIAKIIAEDFGKLKPTWMAAVPRLWESLQNGIYRNVRSQGAVKSALFKTFISIGGAHCSATNLVKGLVPRFRKRSRIVDFFIGIIPYLVLYPLRALGNVLVFKKIQQRLGGEFVAGISGGGALPSAVDRFYAAAGILLLEGYGLTETAPVLSLRLQKHPVTGTIGPIFPGTEVRVVGEDGTDLPPGEQGEIVVRGPQVMKGYYRQPELTAQILSEDGWLRTGDLGMITWDGEIKIVGRAKDTIVLLGGENVEPLPIEQKLGESEYVKTAVLVGQDRKFLGALIIPEMEALVRYATENSIAYSSEEELVRSKDIELLMQHEIANLVNNRNGFKTFERVFRFHLLAEDFEVGDELSAKQEVKRHRINEKFAADIKGMYA